MAKHRRRAFKEEQAAPMESETVTIETMSPAEMAERVREELSQNPGLVVEVVSTQSRGMGAVDIAVLAKEELSRITGLDADRVSAVMNDLDGWHVTVDLVELRRIPPATDMLAAYEALYTPGGSLLSYQRTRRYLRDQVQEGA